MEGGVVMNHDPVSGQFHSPQSGVLDEQTIAYYLRDIASGLQ
jgi:hypothetical protein